MGELLSLMDSKFDLKTNNTDDEQKRKDKQKRERQLVEYDVQLGAAPVGHTWRKKLEERIAKYSSAPIERNRLAQKVLRWRHEERTNKKNRSAENDIVLLNR